ncbi:hypothetical protein PCANC_02842 [Puccinia coronata f. sp. avenae]|uniref:Uncharacterized protein n=1 Tax=Puccinia coronata f. sp. avenae TaxID=200324 RepID=A0A2N5W3Y8_9BASI|nr:hypothetical protein PCANC_02842 [Puccinia coronata f. sp. avenae]
MDREAAHLQASLDQEAAAEREAARKDTRIRDCIEDNRRYEASQWRMAIAQAAMMTMLAELRGAISEVWATNTLPNMTQDADAPGKGMGGPANLRLDSKLSTTEGGTPDCNLAPEGDPPAPVNVDDNYKDELSTTKAGTPRPNIQTIDIETTASNDAIPSHNDAPQAMGVEATYPGNPPANVMLPFNVHAEELLPYIRPTPAHQAFDTLPAEFNRPNEVGPCLTLAKRLCNFTPATFEEFLVECHIEDENQHTRKILRQHSITHWSYFIQLDERSLRLLGVTAGAARFLCRGAEARQNC